MRASAIGHGYVVCAMREHVSEGMATAVCDTIRLREIAHGYAIASSETAYGCAVWGIAIPYGYTISGSERGDDTRRGSEKDASTAASLRFCKASGANRSEEQCQVAVDSMERAGRTLLRTFRGHLGRKACAKARASVRLKAAVRRTVRASEHAEKVDAARRMGGVVRRVGCHSLEQRQRAVRGLEPVLWRAVVQQRLCEVRDAAAHARIDVDPEAVIALRMDL
eukprot:3228945-Rhodomonas_salina.3